MNINQTLCIHHLPCSITILAQYLENILPKLLFSFLKIFIVLKFLPKTQYLSLALLDLCFKLLYLLLIGRMDHFCLLLPFNVGLTSILGYHWFLCSEEISHWALQVWRGGTALEHLSKRFFGATTATSLHLQPWILYHQFIDLAMKLLDDFLHLLLLPFNLHHFSFSFSFDWLHFFKNNHSKLIFLFIFTIEIRLVLLGATSMRMPFVLFFLALQSSLYFLQSIDFIL